MKLKNKDAEFFIPDNKSLEEAFKRSTYLAVAAHQDDIEIMAYDGILKCFGKEEDWFFGVVVTNGAGSPRDDLYATYNDEQMMKVRKLEQKKAAYVGEYGGLAMLDYSSTEVKDPLADGLVEELIKLIIEIKPKVIYTHNLADKHDTHVAVAIKLIKALRRLPVDKLPEKLYGCEVWRNLDWVNDNEKIVFDVSAHPNLSGALVEVFDSQICGGKRYDSATLGRRLSNATYSASHGVDSSTALIYGMDLTELIYNPSMDVARYIQDYISRFEQDVTGRLTKFI